MRIIGFAGLATAGKTTAAEMLARLVWEDGGTPLVRSFAGPLKQAASTVGADKGENPTLYRKFCQVVGTDLMRNPEFCPPYTGPDYWVELMRAELTKINEDWLKKSDIVAGRGTGPTVIIDDVRFMNEVGLIREFGGQTIIVDGSSRGVVPSETWQQHPSEQLALDWHAGKLDDLFEERLEAHSLDATLRVIKRRADFWLGARVDHKNSVD